MSGTPEIGCKRCGKGDAWRIMSDDGKTISSFQCTYCAHIIDNPPVLKNEPDQDATDLRFFT